MSAEEQHLNVVCATCKGPAVFDGYLKVHHKFGCGSGAVTEARNSDMRYKDAAERALKALEALERLCKVYASQRRGVDAILQSKTMNARKDLALSLASTIEEINEAANPL